MEAPLTDDRRAAIPAELKRRVLVEAGHRCAIPTCRHIEVDIHHIVPWAAVQAHDYENLIALCPNCHRRADRGEIDRKALRLYKFNLRTAHDRFSQLEIDMLLMLFAHPEGAGYPWAAHMHIFFNRCIAAGYLRVQRLDSNVDIRTLGVDANPTVITITGKGRAFVQDLGLHEI